MKALMQPLQLIGSTTTTFACRSGHSSRVSRKKPLTPAQIVSKNIDLFWNLKYLFIADTRKLSITEKEAIQKINPYVVQGHVVTNPYEPLQGATYERASQVKALQVSGGHRLGSADDRS